MSTAPSQHAGEDDFFSILHTHHTLPVFASGRAFVPSAIENILSNSFFDVFTPLLPFVYTSPANNVELRARDRLFVFCNPAELNYALHGTYGFSLSTDPSSGKMHLSENITSYTAPTGNYRASDIDKVDYTKLKNSHNNSSSQTKGGAGSERKQPAMSVQKTPSTSTSLGAMSESRSLRMANVNVPFTVVEVGLSKLE